MTVRIACTHCNSGLSMPESMYGKPVRCPKCQQIFTCPSGPQAQAPAPEAKPARGGGGGGGGSPFSFEETAPPATAPARPSRRDQDDDDEDRDRGRRRRRDRDDDEDAEEAPIIRSRSGGWGGVTRGLMFMTIGAGMYVFLVLMLFLLTSSRSGAGTGKAMGILMLLILVGATGMGAVGLGMSIGIPPNSSVRGIAIAGAISMGIATLTGFIITIMLIADSLSNSLIYMALFTGCGMQGGFLFGQFMMAILAKHLNKGGLQASIVGMAVFCAVGPSFILLMSSMGNLMGGGGRGMGGDPGNPLAMVLLIVIGIGAWFIVNAVMLGSAINQVRRKGDI